MAKKARKKSASKARKKRAAPARKKRKAAAKRRAKPAARKKAARKARAKSKPKAVPERKGVFAKIAGAAGAVLDTLTEAERLHQKLEPHVPREPE